MSSLVAALACFFLLGMVFGSLLGASVVLWYRDRTAVEPGPGLGKWDGDFPGNPAGYPADDNPYGYVVYDPVVSDIHGERAGS